MSDYAIMRGHITTERLAAYVAINRTISILADDGNKTTIGEIVDETLRIVYDACNAGRLGIVIASYERDPDQEDKVL